MHRTLAGRQAGTRRQKQAEGSRLRASESERNSEREAGVPNTGSNRRREKEGARERRPASR